MKNLLILHGLGGNPLLNWYSYVADKAKEIGYRVLVPQLPDASKPNLDRTYSFLKKTFSFNSQTILIGHSSGASLALGVLQRLDNDIEIRKTILVSGFIDPNLTPKLHKYIPRSDYDYLFPETWDWNKIKKSCKEFVIFHSLSDPFVQIRHAQTMKEKLLGRLILIPEAMHFSVTSGGDRFREFPELLAFL